MNGSVKIGVLVFPGDKIGAGRADRSDYSFDGMGFNGMKKVLSDLSCPYEYVSPRTMGDCSHVLVSLISFHDILNIIRYVPKNPGVCVVIGGPACANIRPLLSRVSVANFGRCDCGKINGIIQGEKYDSVWYRDSDPDFSGEYAVDASSKDGLSVDEKSFGCRKKCGFCFYSYWNGFASRAMEGEYTSGFSIYEDFIQTLDWEKGKRGAVTALDGSTEETRMRVGKIIKTGDVREALLRSNAVEYDKKLRAKVYNIVGYPWESPSALSELDLVSVAREVDPHLKNSVVIKMHNSHFIPFQKTMLSKSKFNSSDYRGYCVANPVLYAGERITVYSGGSYTPSNATAATSTVLQRAGNSDCVEVLATKKFVAASARHRMQYLSKSYAHLLCEQERDVIDNVKTPYDLRRVK